MYIYMYIYIYTHTHREGGREVWKGRERERHVENRKRDKHTNKYIYVYIYIHIYIYIYIYTHREGGRFGRGESEEVSPHPLTPTTHPSPSLSFIAFPSLLWCVLCCGACCRGVVVHVGMVEVLWCVLLVGVCVMPWWKEKRRAATGLLGNAGMKIPG